jgi:hypothetical protein
MKFRYPGTRHEYEPVVDRADRDQYGRRWPAEYYEMYIAAYNRPPQRLEGFHQEYQSVDGDAATPVRRVDTPQQFAQRATEDLARKGITGDRILRALYGG